jgi:hypothetical protein
VQNSGTGRFDHGFVEYLVATECLGRPTSPERGRLLPWLAAEDQAAAPTVLDDLADAEPRDELTPSRTDEQLAVRG